MCWRKLHYDIWNPWSTSTLALNSCWMKAQFDDDDTGTMMKMKLQMKLKMKMNSMMMLMVVMMTVDIIVPLWNGCHHIPAGLVSFRSCLPAWAVHSSSCQVKSGDQGGSAGWSKLGNMRNLFATTNNNNNDNNNNNITTYQPWQWNRIWAYLFVFFLQNGRAARGKIPETRFCLDRAPGGFPVNRCANDIQWPWFMSSCCSPPLVGTPVVKLDVWFLL